MLVLIINNKIGEATNKSNYRLISLATTAVKELGGQLDIHLNTAITLQDAHIGFRPKFSTGSATFCLKQTIQYCTERETPVCAYFLDLSNAFGLVSYEIW